MYLNYEEFPMVAWEIAIGRLQSVTAGNGEVSLWLYG